MVLVKECRVAAGVDITLSQRLKSLRGLGYVIRNNIVTNIEAMPKNNTLMWVFFKLKINVNTFLKF